jgi:hypothetical protein
MALYRVMVDDNFHYQNPDERLELGTYETAEQALEVCRQIVDRSLEEAYKPGLSAEALYDLYVEFGEDPFVQVIDGADESAAFSAWDCAKMRCHAICGDSRSQM